MFDTHKLNEEGFKNVSNLKAKMAKAVTEALELMPEGREKATFKTKIQEAMFFGTLAVASKEGNFSEVVKYQEIP